MQNETQNKKFMHDKVLRLCVSRAREARLILQSGTYIFCYEHFRRIQSFFLVTLVLASKTESIK